MSDFNQNINIKQYENLMQPIFDRLYKNSAKNINCNKLISVICNPNNILLAKAYIVINYEILYKKSELALLSDHDLINKCNWYINNIHLLTNIPVHIYHIDTTIQPQQLILRDKNLWTKLIQRCILQVLNPICEAKFNNNSYGYRINRNFEHALASISSMINVMHNYYAIDINLKNFYYEVNHNKLMRQLWTLGIHDKKLLFILHKFLKTPIYNKYSKIQISKKGIVQCGLLLPLLTNVTLNELDQRLSSMWCEHPALYATNKVVDRGKKGIDKGHAYEILRKTRLCEVRFVRYKDEVKVITNNYNTAKFLQKSISKWIIDRLKLSNILLQIIKLQQRNLYFNNFCIKAVLEGKRYLRKKYIPRFIAKVNISLMIQSYILSILRKQIKKIQHSPLYLQWRNINKYNYMVIRIQNHYKIATNISQNFHKIQHVISINIYNRFGVSSSIVSTKRTRYSKVTKDSSYGRLLTSKEKHLYGKSQQLIFFKPTKQPIYPIGYIQFKTPMHLRRNICSYTDIGREMINDQDIKFQYIVACLSNQDLYNKSIEYANNRMLKFSEQQGKCAITNEKFMSIDNIHCHHIIPKSLGGTDEYTNLIIVHKYIHLLIHAKDINTINKYKQLLSLDKKMILKINKLRHLIHLRSI